MKKIQEHEPSAIEQVQKTLDTQTQGAHSCCGSHEDYHQLSDPDRQAKKWRSLALLFFGLLILSQVFTVQIKPKFTFVKKAAQSVQKTTSTETNASQTSTSPDLAAIQAAVLPAEGVELPIKWNDLGKRMTQDGVIDEQKFRALFSTGLQNPEEQMLSGVYNDKVVMTEANSRYLLDILWAFGLANKNDILTKGEMSDKQYKGAGNFASTGGWTLGKNKPMDHYSMHGYVTLTPEQQALVDRVSRNIFRPCCGNSTHFPDCNHGMAMLGLLELMAANGVTEDQMYKVALLVNSYWFPQTYMDLAVYFKEQGKDWKDVDAKTVLGSEFSSASGYQKTRQSIKSLPEVPKGGGGCGA